MAALAPAELDRRRAAVTAAQFRELPPPLAERLKAGDVTVDDAINEVAARNEAVDPDWIPDCPLLTVTISGLPRSGKNVLTLAIAAHLFDWGIAVELPEDARSVHWKRALHNLIDRGMRVRLVKEELPSTADRTGC